MSEQMRTVCDICGCTPDGQDCDHTLHYEPCGHDICSNHRSKYGDGTCAKCGNGKDGYHR